MSEEALQKKLQARLGSFAFANPSIKHWNSTGSPIVDLQIRDWRPGIPSGLPGGKFIELYGPNAAGKSSFCCRIGGEAQKKEGKVIYISGPEQGLDVEMAQKAGCRVTPEPSSCWWHLNIFSIESLWGALEDIVEEYHDIDMPVIVVIDSLSSFGVASESMDDSSTKDSKSSASPAKFLHEAFRRGILYYMAGSQINIIAIRHQTESPRPVFRDIKTHGSAPDFYDWLQFKMTKQDMEPVAGVKRGRWLTTTIKKSKVGGLHWQNSMPWYFATGFHEGLEVVWWLENNGWLPKSGGYTTFQDRRYRTREIADLYLSSTVAKDELIALLHASGGVKNPAIKKKKDEEAAGDE